MARRRHPLVAPVVTGSKQADEGRSHGPPQPPRDRVGRYQGDQGVIPLDGIQEVGDEAGGGRSGARHWGPFLVVRTDPRIDPQRDEAGT